MTLQQLRYAAMVAQTGSITEASKRLFISQPSLTNAIHELENEMHITIFNRTSKGVVLSTDGEVFMAYARQVLEQTNLLEEKFLNKRQQGSKFSV
ncbi:MAG: LysR family transcriptional regulator, partial [Lachnospiraceae bacterium]|nr:LysR family transcriptional regulator [Lachnospiraceae bacterium]